MAKKKAVKAQAVDTGVDLSKLSAEQLTALDVSLKAQIKLRAEEISEVNLASKAKIIEKAKVTIKKLKDKFKEVQKKVTVKVLVPMKFELTRYNNSLEGALCDPDYAVYYRVHGGIDKAEAKKLGLTATQQAIFDKSINEFTDGACKEVEDVFPEEIRKETAAFRKELAEVDDLLYKNGLWYDDEDGKIKLLFDQE